MSKLNNHEIDIQLEEYEDGQESTEAIDEYVDEQTNLDYLSDINEMSVESMAKQILDKEV